MANGEIEFLGRLDDQVKVRGFRIELGEIESALEALDGVRQAVVAVKEIGPGNEALVAYLTPANGKGLEPASLRVALAETLPDYMVPQYWVPLAEVPLTANGKVDRRSLPEVERPALSQEPVELTRESERKLAAIWEEVLGVSNFGRADNFFDLGGHSILAARVMTRVRRDLQVDLPLRRIFTAPTLGELAEVIDALSALAEMSVVGNGDDTSGEEVVL
jgi:hypothetical protein